MMSSRLCLTSLVFAATAALAGAQAPAVSLVESYSARAGYSSEEAIGAAEVAVSHFEFGLNGRFAAGNAGMGLAGLGYKTYQIDATGPLLVPESLNEAFVSVGLATRFSSTWAAIAVIKPGFYGDFEEIDGDSFNAPLLVLTTYTARPDLMWTFGLNVNAASENPVLPALGVRWGFAPDWTFNLAFPRTDVTYQASESLAYSLGIRFEGGNYRVTDNLGVPAAGVARLANTYVDFTEIRVGGGLSYAISESMKLQLEAGIMTDRKFDYFDRDYTYNGDAGAFFSISLDGRF